MPGRGRAVDTDADTSPSPPLPRYHDDPVTDEDETSLRYDDMDRERAQEARSEGGRKPFAQSLIDRVPQPVRTVGRAISKWVQGPSPPRIYKINGFFPRIQHAPLELMDRYAPKKIQRFGLLLAFYALWLLAFALLLWRMSFTSEIAGYGAPVKLTCQAAMWSQGGRCGLNGDNCRPFSNSSIAFRCPAHCGSKKAYTTFPVGDQGIIYKQFVIGGPSDASDPIGSAVYRADSFICQAAIHAGFITDSDGGCGVLDVIGEHSEFASSNSNGIESISFDSYFVKAFRFNKSTKQQCKDQRAPVIAVSVIATVILSLFTTSPGVFFWTLFIALYFTTALVTDPPNLANYYALIGSATSRLLPASFCMAIMYKYPVKYALTGVTAQIEKSILWLVPLWAGVLNNYTFVRIPIRRLTPHDLQAQPGAIVALIIIVLIIFAIALTQAWCFRVEGRMPRYLLLYAILGGSLLLMLAVPGMHIRIHHYILALLFLPGTALQTRPSLACQGLLVGFFINGIARWGFDGLLQLPEELFGGDSMGTLLPNVTAPIVEFLTSTTTSSATAATATALVEAAAAAAAAAPQGPANITFSLGPLPGEDEKGLSYDGFSIVVNDVERLRTYRDGDHAGDYEWSDDGRLNWTWTRYGDGMPEYFRFAYMSGGQLDDYTKAGTWTVNGSWVQMGKGPIN